jgi:assimilatory nitrate reductase electron transfer subunit
MTPAPARVVIVGNGMAGARLAEEIRHRDPDATRFAVTVVGEEPHAAYNRVLLSTVVAGGITERDTRLKPDGWWAARHVDVVTGARVTAVDVEARTATLTDAEGAERDLAWDELVLATGSTSFIPPTEGLCAATPGPDADLADGVVAFRTVDDSSRIVRAAESASAAVVLGGGLLGLEAARGLLARGIDVTIVHPQDFPMDRQLDADGGAVLSRVVRGIGARLVLGQFVTARHAAHDGEPAHVVLSDGSALPADLVVVAAGVRPRTDLAVAMGLSVDRGVVVDDRLATSAAHVHAIGECSQHRGEVPGLVQPGWDQARVLADVLTGADVDATYEGTSVLTRLKAHDIDLASMGTVDVDVHDPGHEVLTFTDPSRGRYAKLVLRQDRLVGAILLGVGDAAGALTQLYDTGSAVPRDRLALMLGRAVTRSGAPETANLAEMPGTAVICRCNTVTKSAIVGAFRAGADTVAGVAEATRATTGCGSCKGAVDGLCSWLRSAEPPSAPAEPAQTTTSPTPEPVAAPAALTEGAA